MTTLQAILLGMLLGRQASRCWHFCFGKMEFLLMRVLADRLHELAPVRRWKSVRKRNRPAGFSLAQANMARNPTTSTTNDN
jgi:hypothetical protein